MGNDSCASPRKPCPPYTKQDLSLSLETPPPQDSQPQAATKEEMEGTGEMPIGPRGARGLISLGWGGDGGGRQGGKGEAEGPEGRGAPPCLSAERSCHPRSFSSGVAVRFPCRVPPLGPHPSSSVSWNSVDAQIGELHLVDRDGVVLRLAIGGGDGSRWAGRGSGADTQGGERHEEGVLGSHPLQQSS